MINEAQFRATYPEFNDPTRYTASSIGIQIAYAGLRLNVDRWSDLLDMGAGLFVAHHLALSDRARATAATGGAPGAVSGIVASKSVDKVSVSYDVSSVSLVDGGYWNMTIYGIQFLQLSRMVGAGGIQL